MRCWRYVWAKQRSRHVRHAFAWLTYAVEKWAAEMGAKTIIEDKHLPDHPVVEARAHWKNSSLAFRASRLPLINSNVRSVEM